MKRELIFKAKNINTGEWMGYGTALNSNKLPIDFCSDTECQFTGVLIGDGSRLWENDIVAISDGTIMGVIKFHDGCFVVTHPENKSGRAPINSNRARFWHVVGNVIDNPSLLV